MKADSTAINENLKTRKKPQTRRRPRHIEDDEQAALYQWAAHYVLRGRPLSRRMFAIPNGGKRAPREAKRLKRQGVRAGVSDNFLHVPVGPYAGLFLELKAGKNKPTDLQSEFMNEAREDGYATAIAWGWLEAKRTIINYLEGRHVEQNTGRDPRSVRFKGSAGNSA